MKTWIERQLLILRCHWYRVRYRKELFDLIFTGDTYPDIGEVLTDSNGVGVLIVNSGHREGNAWVLKGYVIYTPETPEDIRPIDMDFVDPALPPGSLVWMHGVLWVKNNEWEWSIHSITEQINA